MQFLRKKIQKNCKAIQIPVFYGLFRFLGQNLSLSVLACALFSTKCGEKRHNKVDKQGLTTNELCV